MPLSSSWCTTTPVTKITKPVSKETFIKASKAADKHLKVINWHCLCSSFWVTFKLLFLPNNFVNITVVRHIQLLLHWITLSCVYYRKCGKICWTKLLRLSQMSRVPQKFSCENKHFSLIILNNKHLWPRQCKTIYAKTSMLLKLWMFSSADLSTSMVEQSNYFNDIKHCDVFTIMMLMLTCHNHDSYSSFKVP